MKLSIVLNCDTRNGFQNESSKATGLFNGCTSEDFLVDSTLNKIKFFDGFDKEIILHIDRHNDVPIHILEKLQEITDCLVIRKHTHETKFNDNSYVRVLSLATGDIICHWDQDTAAFASSKQEVEKLISLLDSHTCVSYPSPFSPNPDVNDSYDYWWCSTRCFMCKREWLDLKELKKCLDDSDYLYSKYPASVKNPWTEHCIGLLAKYNGNGVYYPKIETDKYSIFSWGSYRKGLLKELNNLPYDQVKDFINQHGIHYPCDINI